MLNSILSEVPGGNGITEVLEKKKIGQLRDNNFQLLKREIFCWRNFSVCSEKILPLVRFSKEKLHILCVSSGRKHESKKL